MAMNLIQQAIHTRLLKLATDLEYVELFGKTRAQLRQQFGLKSAPISNDGERDYMGILALDTLSKIERKWGEAINSGALKNLNEDNAKIFFLGICSENVRAAKAEAEQQGIDLLTGEPL